MSKKDLPAWRTDNILPMIMLLGTFFVYLIRLSIVETKIDMIVDGQKTFKETMVIHAAVDKAMELRIVALETVNSLEK